LLIHAGGSGGNAGSNSAELRHAYWLWPLPPPGPLRVSCEWPVARVPFTTVELDATALHDAALRVQRLWP